MVSDKRSRPWWIVAVLVGVVVLAIAVMGLTSLVPKLNPFATEETDRSQPVLLQSIRDLSQYHAAAGEFQVIIDLERELRFVPPALAGERTLFIAAGSVNAFVDFANVTEDALSVSPDRTSVEVRLPEPQLDKPNLDQERSYLFAQQRGVWNRLKALFEVRDQQEFYVLGEQKIAEAAKSAGLVERARTNTRAMLVGMLAPLGYQVTFPADTT